MCISSMIAEVRQKYVVDVVDVVDTFSNARSLLSKQGNFCPPITFSR